ncbi:sugar ABC transporter substrate-binding protein [Saccharothrix deserti]|uniref:sugar ABC transporter substrate-binding protein n=1 Tax=Saccharothrix deserti TaxID=2593674 RepID=UPI00131B01F3|nr:sugar ABC transporter substrate-binding protein [Saccharothrix deserti]
MKKFAALTAAGLVLAACGSGPSGAAQVQQDPSAPFEVWTRSTEATAEVYTELFADFERKTGVKVDYKPVFNDFDKQIQQRAATKDLPDVVITDTGSLGVFTQQGLVGELDRGSVAGNADIVDRAWNNAKAADGKYYAVPFSTQAMVTLIRKDWRERLGKPVPRTWAELADLASAFTTDDPDGNGQADTYGMLVPGTTDRGYLAWWASNYLWQGGGDILEQDGDKFSVAVDSDRTVESVQWLRGLFCDSKVVVPGALTLGTNDAHPFFESGKAGVYLTGPYMFGRFDKSLGKDKYEVVAAPRGPAGATVLGEGENIYLMAGSPRVADQTKLAEFLIGADAQQAGMKGDPQPVVRLPVNKNVDVEKVYDDPRWTAVADAYQDDARPFPNVPNFQPFRQQTSETLNSIFATCGTDVKGELGELAESLEQELRSQGVAR